MQGGAENRSSDSDNSIGKDGGGVVPLVRANMNTMDAHHGRVPRNTTSTCACRVFHQLLAWVLLREGLKIRRGRDGHPHRIEVSTVVTPKFLDCFWLNSRVRPFTLLPGDSSIHSLHTGRKGPCLAHTLFISIIVDGLSSGFVCIEPLIIPKPGGSFTLLPSWQGKVSAVFLPS